MERDALVREQALLNKVKATLEGGSSLQGQQFSAQEQQVLSNSQFLTAKPMMVVVNMSENEVGGLDRPRGHTCLEGSGEDPFGHGIGLYPR